MKKILNDMIIENESGYTSFSTYMETCLYHPHLGYYNKNSSKIGKEGDFYTSSNVNVVFGEVLGKWFLHLCSEFSLPLRIYELGGGTGRIAKSVLDYIRRENRSIYKKLVYIIVDSSFYHQETQRTYLKDHQNVQYETHLDHIDEIRGIVFSNELFDAFPVHIIENRENLLHEVMVKIENGSPIECLVPLNNINILNYLEHQRLELKEKQRIEIPLAMNDYYRSLSSKLKEGIILTIDYGYTNEEWSEPIHSKGSVRGYYKHQMIKDVLSYPGQMDITTHIHWDALKSIGSEEDLKLDAFVVQNEFMISCGVLEFLTSTQDQNPFSMEHKRNRAIRSMIQSDGISSHFKALIQSKGIKPSSSLFPKSKIQV